MAAQSAEFDIYAGGESERSVLVNAETSQHLYSANISLTNTTLTQQGWFNSHQIF